MDKFYNPVRIFQGYHCIKELGALLPTIDRKKKNILVIVWTERILENEDMKQLIEEGSAYHWEFYHFAASNPEVEELFEVYRQTQEKEIDLIIAIGGGSVLDVGKSLCCLYGSEIQSAEELCRKIQEKDITKGKCQWIGVPTTAGTGSEVTCWATIWNSKGNSKLSLERQDNYAYAAFVDPQFAASMPLELAVSSALDAVAHATEAYWAKATNLVSRGYACQAISMIMNHIEDFADPKKAAEVHDYMAQGSMLAGMAFSNTKTTACHSLSYPMTMQYHIPHGIAVSMLLTAVMRKNKPYIVNIEQLYNAYGVADVEALEEKLIRIFEMAGIHYKLRDWNVKKEELPMLAKLGVTKGRIDNNPAELHEEDMLQILQSIY